MPFLPTLVALALLPGAATHDCKSSDLRFAFQPGAPKFFGVFRLKATNASCATAHKVAKDWKKRFQANQNHGNDTLPKKVDGFTFTTFETHAAQTVGMKGRRGAATLQFRYVIPNG
jgi:hypothetical protein